MAFVKPYIDFPFGTAWLSYFDDSDVYYVYGFCGWRIEITSRELIVADSDQDICDVIGSEIQGRMNVCFYLLAQGGCCL